MRKSGPLDALLPRTRQAVLAATMLRPDRWWYLSDLSRHLSVRPSSLQRELASLLRAGILQRRRDGNRVYYRADPSCPFLSELQTLLAKTAGLADVLRSCLNRLAKDIDCAFVFGSIARGEERSTSDIDLLIIGQVGLADVSSPIRKAEKQLQRPINPHVYTRRELAQKLKAGHHFLRAVLEQEKIFIMGNPDDLAGSLGTKTRSAPRHHQARA